MTVGAQQTQIILLIVFGVSIYVINFERNNPGYWMLLVPVTR